MEALPLSLNIFYLTSQPLCSFSYFSIFNPQLSPISLDNNNQKMQQDLFDVLWREPQSYQYFSDLSLSLSSEHRLDLIGGVESIIPPIIDSPIESQTTPQAESTNIIPQQQGAEGPKRDDNTIFKTGVSCYRKSMVEYIKRHPQLKPLLQDIKEVGKGKNMSDFPKLNFMVRWLGLEEVAGIWKEMKEEVLAKKKMLHKNGKFSLKRLNVLEEIIKKMNECIEEDDFDKAFKKYWGKFRQHSKHLTCKENVQEFREQFKKANPDGKMGKRKPAKKETKKPKKTKKTKKTNKTNKTSTIKTKQIRKTK